MRKRQLKWLKLRLNPLSASRAKPGKRPQICLGLSYIPVVLGRQTFSAINVKVGSIITELEEAIRVGVDVCVARTLQITPDTEVTEELVSTRYRFIEVRILCVNLCAFPLSHHHICPVLLALQTYLFSFSKTFGRTVGKLSFFKCMKMLWLCVSRSLLHFLLPGEPNCFSSDRLKALSLSLSLSFSLGPTHTLVTFAQTSPRRRSLKRTERPSKTTHPMAVAKKHQQ